MPVTKSAIKKLRQDRKREVINDKFREDLKSFIKAAKKSKSSASINKAVSIIDKGVKKNILHKNKASRIKTVLSRLAKPVARGSKKVVKKTSKTAKKVSKK